MNEAEKQKIIGELKDFYKKLKSYERYLDPNRILLDTQKRYRDSLRESLVRRSGRLKPIIIKLTKKQYITRAGITWDMWDMGLDPYPSLPENEVSLARCIDATNEAIGKLEKTPLPELELRKEASEAFVVDNREKHPFEEAWEIEIQGEDIKKLYPIITSVAAELHFKDCFFEARLASPKETDSYAPFDVFIIRPPASKTPIGFFALHSLGSNRIVLRVPPCSRWHHDGGLSATELIAMGLSKSEYNEHFGQFIKSLEDRFTHYGLKVTTLKRLWQWLKSHKIFSIFITAIMFIAAIITIWGFVSGTFG